MYNLRSNKKETIQFPVQIQVTDDEQFLTDLLNQNSSLLNSSANMSDSVHECLDSEVDYDAMVQDSDNEIQSTSGNTYKSSSDNSSSDTVDISAQFKVQSVINSQILEQLQNIGKTKVKGAKGVSKQKKLLTKKSDLKLDAKTETHDTKLHTFDSLREDALIQSSGTTLE